MIRPRPKAERGASMIEYAIALAVLVGIILVMNLMMKTAAVHRTQRANWAQCRTVPCRPSFALSGTPTEAQILAYCTSISEPEKQFCK